MAEEFRSVGDALVVAPQVRGSIKQNPQDFQVSEILDIEFSDEGEHVLLHIRKEKMNTEQLAKALARHAAVAYRDVGYCGMKDFFAITEQWFSVGMAGRVEPDWQALDLPGVEILEVRRHARKLKRGAHSANRFRIRIQNLEGDYQALQKRLEDIQICGVPNYFGEQRFGRNGANLVQAADYFQGTQKIKNRNLRGIVLSSARSFLFNQVLSERVLANNWNQLTPGEPANLNGTQSFFTSEGTEEERQRLETFDIHPSAPLWGKLEKHVSSDFEAMHKWELQVLNRHPLLMAGLEKNGLNYQRRATRIHLMKMDWSFSDDSLILEFELNKGQFATSVLREIVSS